MKNRAALHLYRLYDTRIPKWNCSQISLETASRGLFSANSPIFTMASSNEFGMVSQVAVMIRVLADVPFLSRSRFPHQFRESLKRRKCTLRSLPRPPCDSLVFRCRTSKWMTKDPAKALAVELSKVRARSP